MATAMALLIGMDVKPTIITEQRVEKVIGRSVSGDGYICSSGCFMSRLLQCNDSEMNTPLIIVRAKP
jgi:hypothetical protein